MHLMYAPTLECNARCTYCFFADLPQEKRQGVSGGQAAQKVLELVVRAETEGPRIRTVTIQGGEPLLAGHVHLGEVFRALRTEGANGLHLGMQSNLHFLDARWVELLDRYEVNVGTSLDGPDDVTDAQRGDGYFSRTMSGIERLRAAGREPSVICTFTRRSLGDYRRVLSFFVEEDLPVLVHAAIGDDSDSLSAEEYSELLLSLLEIDEESNGVVRVSLLRQMRDQIASGVAGTCTFMDCLGDFLAVGPDGRCAPCNRFLGWSFFCADVPQLGGCDQILAEAPGWIWLWERQRRLPQSCIECAYHGICHGGCPYNVLMRLPRDGKGRPPSLEAIPPERLVDPCCESYRRIYDLLLDGMVRDQLVAIGAPG